MTKMAWTFMICLSIVAYVNAESFQEVKSSKLIGTRSSTFWSDEQVYVKHGEITKIQIASGKSINGFRIRYGNTWGRWHGSTGGRKGTFDISNITSIRGSQHQSNTSSESYIRSIEFTANDGEFRIGPFGQSAGKGKKYNERMNGCRLAYVSGYTGNVDWLLKIKGVIFNWMCSKRNNEEDSMIKDTGLVGGKSSIFWSDEKLYYDHGKITSLEISSEKNIIAIRVRYGNKWSKWHGGTSGKVHKCDLENIVSVRGSEFKGNKTIEGHILSMELTSLDGTRYGPFGSTKLGGSKYIKKADHCHVAFISGYSGAVDWLFKITGIIFHWVCDEKMINLNPNQTNDIFIIQP